MRVACVLAISVVSVLLTASNADLSLQLSASLLKLANTQPQQAFQQWAAHYGKLYLTGSDGPQLKERETRYAAFLDNVKYIQEQQALQPGVQLALNAFADQTWQEFSQARLGFKPSLAQQRKTKINPPGTTLGLPDEDFMHKDTKVLESIDWVEKGVVTGVKNQGQCGSCWAFSTVGSIEGINALKTGKLVALSEQELVDCDSEKNMGCGGGLMSNAFEYIINNGGIDTEEDYSYWSGYGISFWGCNRRKESERTVVSIDSYQEVPADEESLLKAATNQPVAVAICAGQSLMFYAGGIVSSCCKDLNHAVLLTGYATSSDGARHYVVKNSWGEGWGEKGYFRLKVDGVPGDKEGLCGIASMASYPVKTSVNKPVPEMCDVFGWTACAPGNSCSCSYSFFGLVCLWHDCCPLEGGVTCDDLQHCCPSNAPICDAQRGLCASEDGSLSLPWTSKAKAKVSPDAPKEPMQPKVLSISNSNIKRSQSIA